MEGFSNFFFEWLKKNNLENLKPKELTPEVIFKYKTFLSRVYTTKDGKFLKKTTQNYYLIALRVLLTFFAEKDIKSLPPEKIKLLKTKGRTIHFLTLEQIEKLLNAPNTSTLLGLRDRAILETLFSTGMRVSELVSLNRDQVKLDEDVESFELTIIGKGGVPRTVYISKRALFWLKKYLEKREDKEKALFINYKGKEPKSRLTPRSVERIVKKYVLKAGLPIITSPHTLRHSFATDLLIKGVDVRTVQEFLGHKSIISTQIYTHVTKPRLREIHKKFHGIKK